MPGVNSPPPGLLPPPSPAVSWDKAGMWAREKGGAFLQGGERVWGRGELLPGGRKGGVLVILSQPAPSLLCWTRPSFPHWVAVGDQRLRGLPRPNGASEGWNDTRWRPPAQGPPASPGAFPASAP